MNDAIPDSSTVHTAVPEETSSLESIPKQLPPDIKQIRRSDRPKKPSGRWNEEAGFVPLPPRSSKKKIPEDPREAADSHHQSLNEASQKIKRSLNFLSARGPNPVGDPDP
ncbi:uncharacterized protein LOC120270709 [Dioscorea cayenensis subsp. rotundata]|uniref:Uncharacterized protein LOC120270709 n=1 Tax=Dioscorea cayennensis subsp. rotundata TaxID=55577 RepID=A0AB40C1U1_DIOCR|nr:uncharacterized protein LOC120270709 [Dioscorea cayenensis subsp. rotundata]